MPIGRGPNIGHGRGRIVILADLGFEAEVEFIAERIQLVNHLVARLLAEMVDTRDIDEVIKSHAIAGVEADVAKGGFGNAQRGLSAELGFLVDRVWKSLAELFNGVFADHRFSRSSFFCSVTECSFMIFAWSFMRPSRSASGRGGQPET